MKSRCTRCGSQEVTLEREVKQIGFTESSYIVIRCSKCGYSWREYGHSDISQ